MQQNHGASHGILVSMAWQDERRQIKCVWGCTRKCRTLHVPTENCLEPRRAVGELNPGTLRPAEKIGEETAP